MGRLGANANPDLIHQRQKQIRRSPFLDLDVEGRFVEMGISIRDLAAGL